MKSDEELKQVILKLKQYVEASVQTLQFKGYSSKKEAYEEAVAWKDELGQELDEFING